MMEPSDDKAWSTMNSRPLGNRYDFMRVKLLVHADSKSGYPHCPALFENSRSIFRTSVAPGRHFKLGTRGQRAT
jgi:hypothetical protein